MYVPFLLFWIKQTFFTYSTRGWWFENSMEKTNNLYCHTTSRRRTVRSFDSEQHGDLWDGEQTAALTTGLALSCRLDHSLCADGNCVLSGSYLRKTRRYCPESLWYPACREFYVAILFFNLNLYLFSFIWLVALWLLVYQTIRLFWSASKTAGALMIPYLLWITFAGYLNLGIYFLNN